MLALNTNILSFSHDKLIVLRTSHQIPRNCGLVLLPFNTLIGWYFEFDIIEGEVQLINITTCELLVGNNTCRRVVGSQVNGTCGPDRIFQLGW